MIVALHTEWVPNQFYIALQQTKVPQGDVSSALQPFEISFGLPARSMSKPPSIPVLGSIVAQPYPYQKHQGTVVDIIRTILEKRMANK